ncbi:DNA repair protein RecN [Corynebacterium liangguodongii]|uniref:DNA repair protein RecN n=1 Tax=Corynebacterium liangguodongii TaxID=2079535 RepID=A0A2S0WDX4_9CORY|nr:DNA repair protein RecN [Corynebacterium liangguodongii]AWB83966.1 DNA repair protein RecN [Corynebacterium liangguodongii]PWB99977.1 DNA repair protein RecN [Corynebacterium liangguodongii]
MLKELSIENLGVISRASAELSPGLTVLTGETGAGKTMVVSSLRLIGGARADASRVRAGAEQAIVEGAFDLAGLDAHSAEAAREIAEAAGAEADENGEFLVSRSVRATGRSKAHIGGRTVPASTLGEFSGHLLTIHGQNDQLRLLAPEEQLAALDRFDGAIASRLVDYRSAWRAWRAAAKDLRERTEKHRELAQEVDRLKFAINEIDAVSPADGEDEDLVATINRLQDVDTLRDAAREALRAIDGAEAAGGYAPAGDEAAASTLVGAAANALETSSDAELKELGARLTDVAATLSEVSAELGSFVAGLPDDAEELDRLLSRQQDIKALTRKYAPDATGVNAWRAKAARRLVKIDTSAEAIEELREQVGRLAQEMEARAGALTQARTAAARKLEERVTAELHGLAMPKAVFTVEISHQDYTRDGADAVELKLAPAAKIEPQPLATSASGGELSRVMLALEVVLSGSSSGATLVFDEVDAGVGGRAAVEIGRRLARLATHNQVIVVTHLPQVAAYADTHLHVSKHVGDDAVTSGVFTLDDEQRVEELARMLAGMDDSATGRAHAQELRERARGEIRQMRQPARLT